MGLLSKLFGAPDLLSKGLDTVTSAGDKLVFTDEEKKDYHVKFLQLYEPFKIAQRYLALIFSIPYVGICVLAMLMLFSTIFFDVCEVDTACKAAQIEATASKMLEWNNELLGIIVLTIVGFYFMGGAAEGYARVKVATKRKENLGH